MTTISVYQNRTSCFSVAIAQLADDVIAFSFDATSTKNAFHFEEGSGSPALEFQEIIGSSQRTAELAQWKKVLDSFTTALANPTQSILTPTGVA